MADQVRNIVKRKWFTEEELDAISMNVAGQEVITSNDNIIDGVEGI